MTQRRVLVTGGAGFIGSHVADAYLARGDRVWIIDDLSTGKEQNLPGDATFVHANLADAALADIFAEAGGFDIVNHHAAQIDVRASVADPRADARTNVLGLLNVLELSVKHGARRVVFVSSGGVVYGEPEERPTPETAPKAPLSPYGVSKLAAEYYLNYYRRIHGLSCVTLRYGNVYGPRQDPHGEAGVVAIFSLRILAGEPIGIFGDGEQTRDYIFVDDIVRANLLLGDVTPGGTDGIDDLAFNVGTNLGTSVNELARTLMRVSGRTVPVRHLADRPGELRHSRLAVARAAQHGWKAEVSLEEGLAKTYRHIAGEEGSA
jgi:UDP-glucose 4-epimerase